MVRLAPGLSWALLSSRIVIKKNASMPSWIPHEEVEALLEECIAIHKDIVAADSAGAIHPGYERYENDAAVLDERTVPKKTRPGLDKVERCAAKVFLAIKRGVAEFGLEFAPTATYALGITKGEGLLHGVPVCARTDYWLLSLKHYSQIWVVKSFIDDDNMSSVDGEGSRGLGCLTIVLPFQIWPLSFVLEGMHRDVIGDNSSGGAVIFVATLAWDCDSFRRASITDLQPLVELATVCRPQAS